MTQIFCPITQTTRLAAVVAVAIAIALPAPAHCAVCTSSNGGHADCLISANAVAKKSAIHPCCAKHTASPDSCFTPQPCGCQPEPANQAIAERQISVTDTMATLPSVQPLLAIAGGPIHRIAAANENVPLPVPHRILHCSWII